MRINYSIIILYIIYNVHCSSEAYGSYTANIDTHANYESTLINYNSAAGTTNNPLSASEKVDIERIIEIMVSVQDFNGYITQELHDEFWKIMSRLPNYFENYIRDMINDENTYLNELTQSISISFKQHKVFKSEKLIQYENLLLDKYKSRKVLTRDVESFKTLLSDIANNQPVTFLGIEGIWNDDKMEALRSEISSKLLRSQYLLQKDWKALNKEFNYPEYNISIYSITPFSNDGIHSDMMQMHHRLNEYDQVIVSFIDKQILGTDDLPFFAKKYIRTLGAQEDNLQQNKWNGMNAISINSIKKITDTVNVYSSYKMISVPNKGNLILYSITLISASKAIEILSELESKIHLIQN